MIARTFNIAPQLPSLFVNKAVFSLRESILLSTITVKMVVNMVFMQCHLQQVWHRNIYITSWNVLLPVIYMWTLYRYVSLRDYLDGCLFQLVLILIFYCVLMCLHDVKQRNIFIQTCFYFLEYDVISQQRHS